VKNKRIMVTFAGIISSPLAPLVTVRFQIFNYLISIIIDLVLTYAHTSVQNML